LDRPTKGHYIGDVKAAVNYTDEEAAGIRSKKIGFIFQTFNLLPRTTVLENVLLPLMYSDLPEESWDNRARSAIDQVGLSHRVDYDQLKLSGGERQRVAAARALVNNPDIIFADEPTGNLDSKSGNQIMKIIESFHKRGRTIILITHETYTAKFAERIIHIKDGRIESDEQVKRRHSHEDLLK
ncbi:ATP-binding cassette domain-containing protein, partial [Patescibacteria group bacterium]|nr:ATP-binding cassette domain-containing protein [Patescibacteria group bacterium]